MEEIVFKLFERQPNWSLRNLIQETDQPEVCALSNIFLLISSFCLLDSTVWYFAGYSLNTFTYTYKNLFQPWKFVASSRHACLGRFMS